MTIDQKQLDYMRKDWQSMNLEEPRRVPGNFWDLIQMREKLEKMGLDLAQDATYELLADGLTKAVFDAAVAVAGIRCLNHEYHGMMDCGFTQYSDQYNQIRFGTIERMQEYTIPYVEEAVKRAGGVPAALPSMEVRQYELVMAMQADGTLADAKARAAIGMAHSEFRGVFGARENMEKTKPGAPHDEGAVNSAWSCAKQALRGVEAAGAYYKPCAVPVDWGMKGLDLAGRKAPFSKEIIEDSQRFFEMRKLAIAFTEAARAQDERRLNPDTAVQAMQDIAETLVKKGYDLAAPETYVALGTDIHRFRECYQRERDAIAKSDRAKNLRPELKI